MKSRKWFYFFALILILPAEIILLAGCRKHDEENMMSERSELLTSTWWRFNSYNGQQIPEDQYTLFKPDGNYYEYDSWMGTWKLQDYGNTLSLTSGWIYSYEILVLNENELKYREKYFVDNYNLYSYTSISDPILKPLGASDLSKTTAKLHSSARANKLPVELTFEYGTSTSYGHSAVPAVANVTALTYNDKIEALISGLDPETVYHYRLKASTGSEEFTGPDLTFRTFDNLTVTDICGNTYNTVTINNQVWMAQNLMVPRYNDGKTIPLVTSGSEWGALTSGGYCWFNNDSITYKNSSGALYNWFAVNSGKLCPAGWHVPGDQEWAALEQFLGATEAGDELFEYGSNTTGFSARYGGFRWYDEGDFGPLGCSYFWTTTEENDSSAFRRNISSFSIEKWPSDKKGGFSVRCLKD
jgi:uncharacterized protein (TIGR02145 family)